MRILLKSATIIDQHSDHHQKKQDILIENGIIVEISNSIKNQKNDKIISFDNLHVSNGWFDTSVSLGEPGFEERENLNHGLNVAAKSGFTAVAINPNTYPLIDNKSAVEFLKSKGSLSGIDTYPIACLTNKSEGKDIAELYDMANFGAIAFGDYNKPISNANLLKIALLYAQNFDGLVMSFPLDETISKFGFVNESKNSTALGLKSIPSLAEELQIARDLFLLEYTGGKLHIPTITTKKSVKLIKDAKKKGLNVTCSVSVHHLLITDDALSTFDSNFKVTPPLRSKADTKALINGVLDGTIDIITSDHNPIDIENKKLEIGNALYGTIGLESCFAALNTIFDLNTIANAISTNPRQVFGLSSLKIEKGSRVNLSLFNPENEFTFDKDHILSTSKNSIFLNKKLKGKVYGIINNEKLILN